MTSGEPDLTSGEPDLRHIRTADGVTIAYQVMGSGPTVIWLPSLGDVRAQWQVPVLREAYRGLASSFRLVLFDGRGMGSSDRRIDENDLGLTAHLRDLSAVVDAVAVGPVSLFGWYHSVTTAVAYAAEHGERVARLVLFGGAPRLRDAMSPVQTQALLSLVDQDWELFAESAAHIWLGWDSAESGRMLAQAFRSAATPTIAKAWFAAAAGIDVTQDAGRVRAPTLVLHRQGARQIPVEVSRRFADALPGGRLLELPGSSPTLFLDDPVGDLAVLSAFLRDGRILPPPTGPAPEPPAESATERLPGGLTPRQAQVLRLVASGESNVGIARRLGIAEHTVERHLADVYRKIGARGRADATAFALRNGLA